MTTLGSSEAVVRVRERLDTGKDRRARHVHTRLLPKQGS